MALLAVTNRKSGIPHPDAGFWLFVGRCFGAGETIMQYCGTVVYNSLVDEKQK